MKRIVKNNLDQQLINSMVLYHELLKESFKKKERVRSKIIVPEFNYSELVYYTELKNTLECLKHNYRELLKYIKIENYSPMLKVIFLYDYEYCVPTVINMTLKEFLASDLYIGKEEINIKPRDIGIY
ncbi:hypothetical protein M2102_002810 [Fusobacterium sp. PH5-7]|uniref:hypothetical protein n=1 Tax=Fusobacterium sp. PH5-7 TaxID=2940528 RepID=UPI00247526F5|nr:hypothetical protein [Fusobacterium sp. PH5-7]MDH6459160.1 hypothetical protein [Fusobacterium sp. PH5-7]